MTREKSLFLILERMSLVLLDLQFLQDRAQLQNLMQTIPIFKVLATVQLFKYTISQTKRLHGWDSAIAQQFAISIGLIKKLYFKRNTSTYKVKRQCIIHVIYI